jgi:biotin carboxyl carrier protein
VIITPGRTSCLTSVCHAWLDGERVVVARPRWSGQLARGSVTEGGVAEEIRAEMVASVVSVVVTPGTEVEDGDTLVMLESMKMEIPVITEVPGTVSTVAVRAGDVVQCGDLIAVVE